MLGAGPLRRAREVTLPQLAPALSAASALTFLFCFTSFGVILILGGPGRATVETEIYNRAARLFDLQAAAALSLLQLGAVALVLTVASVLEARAGAAATLADENDVLRRPHGWSAPRRRRVLAAGALVLVLPLALLVDQSRGSWGTLCSRRRRRCSSSRGRPRSSRSRSRVSRPRSPSPSAGSRRSLSPAGRRASSTGSCCSRSAPRR